MKGISKKVEEKRTKSQPDKVICDERLAHIAFIMDGNGTWAKKRGLPRTAGHRAGAKSFKALVEYLGTTGLKHMTVYAFSTENWSRPKEEVDAIMDLLDEYIEMAAKSFRKNNVRVIFLGDRTPLKESLRIKMDKLEKDTENWDFILNIAINYGSHDEIVRAVNKCIADGVENVSAEDIEKRLDTRLSPHPDLIVRTGSEVRLSNFLLWQAQYAELYFTDTLWPDFDEKEANKAITEFYKRKRKKGGLI